MQWAGSERAATGRAPLTPPIRGSIAGSAVSSQGGGTRAPGKSCSRCFAARATGSTGTNERREAPKAALSPTGLNHHRIRAEKIAATAAFGGNGAPGEIRTHDRRIDKPKPNPFFFVVANASNGCACISGEIPVPLSTTPTSTDWSSWVAVVTVKTRPFQRRGAHHCALMSPRRLVQHLDQVPDAHRAFNQHGAIDSGLAVMDLDLA